MKKLLSIILVLLSMAVMMCGCGSEEKQSASKTKETTLNVLPALDFRNTDDENLQLAVKVVDDIYESEIDTCYKAEKGEYPEPNIDEGKIIEDFYKFTLKNKATVTVGARADGIIVVMKSYTNGEFRHVNITADGCIITDKVYGQ